MGCPLVLPSSHFKRKTALPSISPFTHIGDEIWTLGSSYRFVLIQIVRIDNFVYPFRYDIYALPLFRDHNTISTASISYSRRS